MSRLDNYLIVAKPFFHEVEFLQKGSPVDITDWTEVSELIQSGYLRSPHTIEEWELIQESARGIKRDPYRIGT